MKHDPELKYKCPACPKQFVMAKTLRMHISNVHRGNNNKSTCKMCDEVLSDETELQKHLILKHSNINTSQDTILPSISNAVSDKKFQIIQVASRPIVAHITLLKKVKLEEGPV